MTKEKKLTHIISRFCSTLEKVGAPRMLEHLDLLESRNYEDHELKSFIIKTVCNHFGLTHADIVSKQGKRIRQKGVYIDCRDITVVMLYKYSNLSNLSISKEFFFNKSNITNIVKAHENKDVKIPHQREYLANFNEIEKIIVEHKNNK